jgi:hypothetical protein
MVRGARHADVSLFTEYVELHRLKNRSDTCVEGCESDQAGAPSDFPSDQEADEDRSEKQAGPISIDRFDVLERGFLFRGWCIAGGAKEFSVVATIATYALQDRFIESKSRTAVVAEEAAALGAVVGFGVNFGTADRALRSVSQSAQFGSGRGCGGAAAHGWDSLGNKARWGMYICGWKASRIDAATLTRFHGNSIDL